MAILNSQAWAVCQSLLKVCVPEDFSLILLVSAFLVLLLVQHVPKVISVMQVTVSQELNPPIADTANAHKIVNWSSTAASVNPASSTLMQDARLALKAVHAAKMELAAISAMILELSLSVVVLLHVLVQLDMSGMLT